jgi:hypothetical protein
MDDYFFPALLIVPEFDAMGIEHDRYSLAKRRWSTSIFDLATLATKHRLHLPYQVMDVFLARCHSEICVRERPSLESAVDSLKSLKLALYGSGISPFVTPFGTTHSINEYSGINSRDSETLRQEMPIQMQTGLKSDEATLEAWPVDLSFECVVLQEGARVTESDFATSCDKATRWLSMIEINDTLRAFSDAALSSAMMSSLSQSIMHMWCAIESLFPSVSTELSFRVSLYLAELISQGSARREYFESVRKSYNVRSKIAHGAKHDASFDEWKAAWEIVMGAFNAIVAHGVLPSEDALLADLLA